MAKSTEEVKKYDYSWSGVDRQGAQVKGELSSTSETTLRLELRTKGIRDIKVKKRLFLSRKRIKQSEIAGVTRQLSTMIRSGVSILQSLEIVASGHSNSSVTKMLYDIKNKVEAGSSMSNAFSSYPRQFDSLYCNLVGVGEKSGSLDDILDRLATYQEKISLLKSKIKKAMIYPIAVIIVAFFVIAIIMSFVIPSFKEVFTSFGTDLPAPTLFVIAMSDMFVNNWYIIIGGIIGAIYLFFKLKRDNQNFQSKLDRISVRLPVFGRIFQKSAIAKWCRTLGTMFHAGVPLVEALDSVAGASGNVIYYNATKNIQKNVATGQSLTVAMQNEKIFPVMMTQMTKIGEESGSLDVMLNKVAEIYEVEVDDSVSSLSSLLEPFILVFLGVLVGGLVISMYLPIFKMASVV